MLFAVYIVSFVITFLISLLTIIFLELDSRLTALYLVKALPISISFYLLSILVVLPFKKKFYRKNKKIFAIIPNLICFLFWFSGTIVYNFLYSKMDITDFKIFALPHLITILILLAFYFFTKNNSLYAESPPRDSTRMNEQWIYEIVNYAELKDIDLAKFREAVSV